MKMGKNGYGQTDGYGEESKSLCLSQEGTRGVKM